MEYKVKVDNKIIDLKTMGMGEETLKQLMKSEIKLLMFLSAITGKKLKRI